LALLDRQWITYSGFQVSEVQYQWKVNQLWISLSDTGFSGAVSRSHPRENCREAFLGLSLGVISENGKNCTLTFFRDFFILMQQVWTKSQSVSYA